PPPTHHLTLHDALPISPPTRWMPTTLSESSKPSTYRRSTTRAQTTPASAPSTSVQPGLSTLQEGAAATSPTTSPEAAPTEVTFPDRKSTRLNSSHVSIS